MIGWTIIIIIIGLAISLYLLFFGMMASGSKEDDERFGDLQYCQKPIKERKCENGNCDEIFCDINPGGNRYRSIGAGRE